MAEVRDGQGSLVFGLDIGTRSIVGTVGYMSGDKFHIVAQYQKEHETRAMLDGQIHDILKVGNSIKVVKEELERSLGKKLENVCIAAAGRVLRTVTTTAELCFDAEKEITAEDIHNLLMNGVEKAYGEFQSSNDTGLKFFCVGYTPMHYYMNGYQIGNLEDHKASKISVDIIATFLPDDVVDGLYKAVEIAGLKVVNMTLEPIAAIQVAIPEKFRMLNLALIDVGAGTSDISITKDGTIVAYGMIPVAGDALTDIIVQHCLVDFETAEMIKRASDYDNDIEYTDILGLPQVISSKEVLELLNDKLEEMSSLVAAEISKLNGDKSVSAVFVVGGGGMIRGYTDKVSEKLGIVRERVAIRGKEVMQNIVFDMEDARKDSLMVTPIGICLCYYEQSNNFIFVNFNGESLKLYDNGRLTISDCAMQVSFPNADLFPKRGKALTFTVNGNKRMVRGRQGEPSSITLNGEPADLYTKIGSGDIVKVIPSTAGVDAVSTVANLKEYAAPLHVQVNGKNVSLPKKVTVNGNSVGFTYEIKDGDQITVDNFYTAAELVKMLELSDGQQFFVNGTPSTENTKVFEGFALDFTAEKVTFTDKKEDESVPEHESDSENESVPEDEAVPENEAVPDNESVSEHKSDSERENVSDALSGKDSDEIPAPKASVSVINVTVNDKNVVLSGKRDYVFVDVFDYIDFDLKNPAGRSVVTKLNGMEAEYLEALHEGDILEIYWKQE